MSNTSRALALVALGTTAAALSLPNAASGAADSDAASRTPMRHVVPKKPTPGWHTLSAGSTDSSLNLPSVARFGNDLQVVWTQVDSTGAGLYTQLLDRAGKPESAHPTRILHWDSLINDPAIRKVGNQRVIVFSGERDTSTPSDPYDKGYLDYLTSTDGKTWTLSGGSASHSDSAGSTYGLGVAVDDGSVVTTFTEASSNVVKFHDGLDSSRPASTPDGTATPLSGSGYLYDVNNGVDATTGKAYALWYGAAASRSQMGVDAQQIEPSKGSILNGPLANTIVGGSPSATAPNQDVPSASRAKSVGGGLYTAYMTYAGTKIVVWRVGTNKPALTIPSHYTYSQLVGITPSLHGRLWVFWRTSGGDLRVVRTNTKVSRVGDQKVIHPPRGLIPARLSGDGSQGPLNLVALLDNAAGKGQVESINVFPGMHATVSAKSVARGKAFTVTLTDAGQPVKGAKCTFEGSAKTTNRQGKVTFKVPRSTPAGRHPIRFSAPGYSSGKISVRVTD